MRTVHFYNDSVIDLAAIAVMGVSVKEGPTPIGYFGTGLKFAIATLLRTGHEVHLELCRPEHTIADAYYPAERTLVQFTARPEVIRGETFQRVHMEFNGGSAHQPLGFTTNLGRNWEPWMAYRELRSNAMDEQGTTSFDPPASPPGTWFRVTGEAVAQCHETSGTIFLETAPVHEHKEANVHAGACEYAFYRGVRAHKHQMHSLLTYNVLHQCSLTEDRTVAAAWEVGFHAARSLAQCHDMDTLEVALLAAQGTFEHGLSYDSLAEKPSAEFMSLVEANRNSVKLNLSARKAWEKFADARLAYRKADLTAYEEGLIQDAISLVRRLTPVERTDFLVLDGMGEGIMGLTRHGLIYISHRVLDKGVRYTASTIYEELLHRNEGLTDESRDLQNFLFDKLLAVTEQLRFMERGPSAPWQHPPALEEALVRLRQEPNGLSAADAKQVLGDDEIPF